MSKTLEQIVKDTVKAWQQSETADFLTSRIASNIRHHYRIEPKGTPIKPEDVRAGDRIRFEWQDGETEEFTAESPYASTSDGKFYLLDRPHSDADFEFPTGEGAVIRMRVKVDSKYRAVAARESGTWFLAGSGESWPVTALRNCFHDFEVLSDGSEQ